MENVFKEFAYQSLQEMRRFSTLTWPPSTSSLSTRFWVLWGQCKGQHQREADFWAPRRHHLWKDVRESGRRWPRGYRGQTGASAHRAARPSSPGLCMLRRIHFSNPFFSRLYSCPSWAVPQILRSLFHPLFSPLLVHGLIITRWKLLKCSDVQTLQRLKWFILLCKEKKGVFIKRHAEPKPEQLQSRQSISDSLQLRCWMDCFTVPQCGLTRRIWRLPSSECHLNPSKVYTSLFHIGLGKKMKRKLRQ